MDPSRLVEVLSSSGALIVAVVTVIVAILTYMRRGRIKVGQVSLEFDRGIESEVEQVRKRISEETPEASPADKQYMLLKEYHAQGLAQSKISFWFSLIFASLGFAVRYNRHSYYGEKYSAYPAGTDIYHSHCWYYY